MTQNYMTSIPQVIVYSTFQLYYYFLKNPVSNIIVGSHCVIVKLIAQGKTLVNFRREGDKRVGRSSIHNDDVIRA